MSTNTINTVNSIIIPFTHEKFGQIGTIKDERTGELWFTAKDIAIALGYTNPAKAIRDHCKKVNKITLHNKPFLPPVNLIVIPEADVYRLIMRSNLPAAEQFEAWVMEEVLPSLNKHGGYLTPAKLEEALLNPDTLIQLATTLKEERTRRQLAEAAKDKAEAALAVAKPKAQIVDAAFARRKDGLIKLTDFIRKFGKVNTMKIKDDLRRLGYFYKTSWNATYRVYAEYRKALFAEKYDEYRGTNDIYVTVKGAELVTQLYKSGKLTMKAGC